MYAIGYFFLLFFIGSIQSMEIERPFLMEAFKKKYVNCYHALAVDESMQKSLIEHAPAELQQWFNAVALDYETDPVLLYGAHGVGKTLTTQALTKKVGCPLLYVEEPWTMQDEWIYKKDEKAYIASLQEKMCVIIDNVSNFSPEAIEPINALLQQRKIKKNMHLLVIAYHAKNNMPQSMYTQFQPMQFPNPSGEQRSEMLRYYLARHKIVQNIHEHYIQDSSLIVPQDIPLISEIVKENIAKQSYSPESLVSCIKNAVAYAEKEKADMEVVFDENE